MRQLGGGRQGCHSSSQQQQHHRAALRSDTSHTHSASAAAPDAESAFLLAGPGVKEDREQREERHLEEER